MDHTGLPGVVSNMAVCEMLRKMLAQNNHSRHTAIIINEKAMSPVKEIISTEAHLSVNRASGGHQTQLLRRQWKRFSKERVPRSSHRCNGVALRLDPGNLPCKKEPRQVLIINQLWKPLI